jgi:hypothetical protein
MPTQYRLRRLGLSKEVCEMARRSHTHPMPDSGTWVEHWTFEHGFLTNLPDKLKGLLFSESTLSIRYFVAT